MRDGMRVLSLFSGLGAFDIGLELAGMEIVGQVEIDPTCLRVLEHHWPSVRRWTDVRAVSRESVGVIDRTSASRGSQERRIAQLSIRGGGRRAGVGRAADHLEGQPLDAEAGGADAQRFGGHVDLVCGGFPCQDVSVAGQRAGLDGARSGLWFEFQRILRELRPRWAIIENVPGLLSSNQGADFGVILDGLGECGFGGISWAVLDSQHFGVPQRRRRVFIVCGPTSRSSEQVLSLCESCGGHSAAGRTEREGTAAEIEDGVATPLTATGRGTERTGESRGQDTLISEAYGGNRTGGPLDVAAALGAHGGPHGHLDFASDTFIAIRTAQTSGMKQQTYIAGAAVRRLTPTECLRLQGLPDDWLDLGLADGPKYRMVGNAVTVPVVEYLGRRILEIDRCR